MDELNTFINDKLFMEINSKIIKHSKYRLCQLTKCIKQLILTTFTCRF